MIEATSPDQSSTRDRDDEDLRDNKRWYHLSRWTPKGLMGRTLLILSLPLMIAQGIVGAIFIERHAENVAADLTYSVAQLAATILDLYEPQTDQAIELATTVAKTNGLQLSVLDAKTPLDGDAGSWNYSWLLNNAPEIFGKHVQRPFGIHVDLHAGRVELRVQFDDHVLAINAPRARLYPVNFHIFLGWMIFAITLFQGIGAYLMSQQITPIKRLAHQAAQIGHGAPFVPLPLRGSHEVRLATRAFNRMNVRLNRYVMQRTTMLAGVSHDLRTMLTRLKLGLEEFTPTEEVKELQNDVNQMARVVEDYLEFARGVHQDKQVTLNIEDMINNMVESLNTKDLSISVTCSGPRELRTIEMPLRRSVMNIITNATYHAQRRVRVTVAANVHDPVKHQGGDSGRGILTLQVDDDGGGVPEADWERAFEPFVRFDTARNQSRAGSGLGLTITRDCARLLGGDATLSASPLGGLRATIWLPI